ncbi:toll/interleukin-1 receptor domain-containing protein [Novosphingobium aerophilum]|uniref:toll/interleukin-1 receptor domain-containing protein n=1 Tax=Novosphingobium TaxID=165696 RepID=UPI002D79073B|nr:toll/interleukin-1 receptor domain-containing protein [Novosphingobium sp. RL4]WRT95554.1 toll/interleukin-1 receptor domain-containing protein [Novosphingobium sp. RL4]
MKANEETPGPGGERRFRAFLSYSHADEHFARKLHQWLESYRIPPRLVGSATPMGHVPPRLSPIFRDRAELPAASSLDEEVRQALSQSDALLVLCSPAARASRWVDAEIALFRSLHPDRPIIAALVLGDPAVSFPSALLEPDAEGVVREPIAADFRPDHDGARLARLKIVAGLTGVALDQIIQRDAQRQLRRVIAITLLTVLLTLSMALMLIFALRARIEAEHQRQQAEGLIEFMLTDLRQRLEGVGRLDVLQSVNKRALDYYADQSDLKTLPADSLERRARILHAMGEDDHKRGDVAGALAKFSEAHRVTGALLAASPQDPPRLFAHAQSEFWLGYVDFIDYRYEKALPRFIAYRGLAEQLVRLVPGDQSYWRELAYAQGNICTIAVTRRGPEKQLAECSDALATMERVGKMVPGDLSVKADIANRHAWMADALRVQGRNVDALHERAQQAAIVQRLLKDDPKNVSYLQDWMLARYSMSQLLNSLGERHRAEKMREDARRDVERLIESDPENNDWRLWKAKLTKPLDK